MKRIFFLVLIFLSGMASGQVTSFSSNNLAPLFTTSVANPTSTPTLSFTLTAAGANTLFGNCTPSSGSPSYTSLATCINAGLLSPGPIGTTVPNTVSATAIIANKTNFPNDPLAGGNFIYDVASITCTQNQLPGDNGGLSGTVCVNLNKFSDWSPGWNYGSPGTMNDNSWFTSSAWGNQTPYISSYSAGIHQGLTLNGTFTGSGDLNFFNSYAHVHPAWIAGSDEGVHSVRQELDEMDELAGTVSSKSIDSTGATILNYSCTANCSSLGLNSPLIDTSSSTSGSITAVSFVGVPYPNVAIATTSFTVPTSVSGNLASGIGTYTIQSGGSGYIVGDIIAVTQSGASDGQLQVTSLGGGGSVTGLAPYTGGTAYSTASSLATTGGTGTGLTVNITGVGIDIPRTVSNATNQLSVATRTIDISAPSAPTTSTLIDILGPAFNEVIIPQSVTTVSAGLYRITAAFRYSHAGGTQVCIGGAVGSYVEMTNYTVTDRYLEQVLCSPTANSVWLGHQVPGGFGSFATVGPIAMYQGGEVVGVYNPATSKPSNGYAVLMPNNAAFTPGATVQNTGNIAANYFVNLENDSLINPFANRINHLDEWHGLGGGYLYSSGWMQFDNNNSDTNYIGTTNGRYYAPSLISAYGPVANGLALQYAPMRTPAGMPVGFIPNCQGYLLCIGSGPSPNSTSPIEGIFSEGDQTTTITYDHTAQQFSFKSNGGSLFTGNVSMGAASTAALLTVGTGTGAQPGIQFHNFNTAVTSTYFGLAQNSPFTSGTDLCIADGGTLTGYSPMNCNRNLSLNNLNSQGSVKSVTSSVGSSSQLTIDSNGNLTTSGKVNAAIYTGPATAPSGSCTTVGWVFSQDGHATFCNGTTWVVKI